MKKARDNRQQETGEIGNRQPKIQNWAAVALLLWGYGCGYQLSGKGETFPKDVRSVFVESLVNRTREVGIDREITAALRSELHRRGQLRVVDRLEDADAILSGAVRTFENRVVAVNKQSEALQFEMVLTLDIGLR